MKGIAGTVTTMQWFKSAKEILEFVDRLEADAFTCLPLDTCMWLLYFFTLCSRIVEPLGTLVIAFAVRSQT